MIKFYFIILLLLCFSCSKENLTSSDCTQITASAKTYDEATNIVELTDFKFVDDVDTSSSSWIRSADYYSCDGETGYFIYTTDKKKYIHENLPLDVWNDFKNAESFGAFYNKNIKHRYRLITNDE